MSILTGKFYFAILYDFMYKIFVPIFSNLICLIKAVYSIQQYRHPINDVILLLASDWLFLIIETSMTSNDQSVARKRMT